MFAGFDLFDVLVIEGRLEALPVMQEMRTCGLPGPLPSLGPATPRTHSQEDEDEAVVPDIYHARSPSPALVDYNVEDEEEDDDSISYSPRSPDCCYRCRNNENERDCDNYSPLSPPPSPTNFDNQANDDYSPRSPSPSPEKEDLEPPTKRSRFL